MRINLTITILALFLIAALFTELSAFRDAVAARRETALGHPGCGGVLLVLAHPDDESMFFAPTLADAQVRQAFSILYLSTGAFAAPSRARCPSLRPPLTPLPPAGNGSGLGAVRTTEAIAAAAAFGVPRERVHVVDDPRLQDGEEVAWPPAAVAAAVQKHLDGASGQPLAAVVTFDARGASGHVNHVATHRGVVQALAAWEGRGRGKPLPALYTLRSVPKLLFLKPLRHLAILLQAREPSSRLLLVPTSAASHAGMAAHASQYVWHRWLHVWCGPYATANVLDEEHVVGREAGAAAVGARDDL